MREIKFRGQRLDNKEWVYGCLINNLFFKASDKTPCCYIIPDTLPEKDEFGNPCYYDCFDDVASWISDFEVDPNTVGQYTGENDNKKADIYEGCICRCWLPFSSYEFYCPYRPTGHDASSEIEGNCIVEFIGGAFYFKVISVDKDTSPWHDEYNLTQHFIGKKLLVKSIKSEVISSSHTHPNLLNKQ